MLTIIIPTFYYTTMSLWNCKEGRPVNAIKFPCKASIIDYNIIATSFFISLNRLQNIATKVVELLIVVARNSL